MVLAYQLARRSLKKLNDAEIHILCSISLMYPQRCFVSIVSYIYTAMPNCTCLSIPVSKSSSCYRANVTLTKGALLYTRVVKIAWSATSTQFSEQNCGKVRPLTLLVLDSHSPFVRFGKVTFIFIFIKFSIHFLELTTAILFTMCIWSSTLWY